MWILNSWIVNLGTGVLGYAAWLLSKSDHLILFLLCTTAIAVWNFFEGYFKKDKSKKI